MRVCAMERVWKREIEKERGQTDRWIHLLMQLCGYVCACVREREYVEERKRKRERESARARSYNHGCCVCVCVTVLSEDTA